MPLECDAALSDAVLQAARAALPTDPVDRFAHAAAIRKLGPKNALLFCLLGALLDAAEAVANAMADNAFDDSRPVDRRLAEELANQSYRVGVTALTAGDAPALSPVASILK